MPSGGVGRCGQVIDQAGNGAGSRLLALDGCTYTAIIGVCLALACDMGFLDWLG